jgi:hypothetical protein
LVKKLLLTWSAWGPNDFQPLPIVSPPLPVYSSTQALILDAAASGSAHISRNTCAVGFASVTAGNERDGFFVIHRHAGKSPDILPQRSGPASSSYPSGFT